LYASLKPTLGRRMIMTDERIITKDNIIKVVSKAFEEHQYNVRDEMFLYEYERGNQPILGREKKIRPELNARVVENGAARIVDIHLGYCFSNPITFVQRAKVEPTEKQQKHLFGFLKKKNKSEEETDDLKIAMLNKMMYEQSKTKKDLQLGHDMFITGVGYQIVLPSRDKSKFAPFEIAVPSPLTTFVVYSNDAFREPMLGCTYFIHEDGTISLTAYSKDLCFVIEHELSTDNYRLTEKVVPNTLGQIPIVEFALTDRMGIFEKAIPILDAINIINSDRINDIMQHVQSLLWMHNCSIDGEGKKNLVDGDGVIMTKSSGDSAREAKITYLSQTLNQSEIQTFVDYYMRQVEQLTSTPSWQEASGGSTTGAMQLSNGWQCLEISAKTVEQMFVEPEMQVLDLAVECLKADTREYDGLKDIELADIEIRFCRTKTYDLVSKTNALVSLLNAGVDGLTAFNTVGLFTDPQQAWVDSKKIIDGMQKKIIQKEEPKQQNNNDSNVPNPNAFKDEEGNGGENNQEKDKTDESVQPSKVAQVEE